VERKFFIGAAYAGAALVAIVILLSERHGYTLQGHFYGINLLGMLASILGAPVRFLFPGDTYDDFLPTVALLAGLFWLLLLRVAAWLLDLALGEEHG
jgi:hypothetical protein